MRLAPVFPRQELDGKPNIPDGVSFVESFVQFPISAVLISLLLLAVKNRFKIK